MSRPHACTEGRQHRRLQRGGALLLGAWLLSGCAVPAPRVTDAAAPVQAYVSAALLDHWCRSSQPLDVEACLSYLRGHFDTLALQRSAARDLWAEAVCIPATAAITELRERVRERRADAAADRVSPAARMLTALWRDRYPCAGNSGQAAAGHG